MKKLIIAIIAIFIVACSSSQSIENPTTTVLTIFDKTEGQSYKDAVNIEWYLKEMNVDPSGLAIKTKGQGVALFTEFSSFSLNKMQKFELSFTDAKNPLMKQGKIDKFMDSFRTGLSTILASSAKAENSQIFGPMAQSISQMGNANHKVVLLFSDMIENGGQVSFYSSTPSKEDRTKLEVQYGLKMPDLKDVKVYIIYNPSSNPQTAELARQSSKFFSEWMKEKGAKVEIVANLLGVYLKTHSY